MIFVIVTVTAITVYNHDYDYRNCNELWEIATYAPQLYRTIALWVVWLGRYLKLWYWDLLWTTTWILLLIKTGNWNIGKKEYWKRTLSDKFHISSCHLSWDVVIFAGFRAIGCGILLSVFSAIFINFGLSQKTRSVFLFPSQDLFFLMQEFHSARL